MDGLTQPIITGDDLLTITQNLTRRLSIGDLGRTLKCVAKHIALDPRDSVATAQIKIQCWNFISIFLLYYKNINKFIIIVLL